MTEYYFDSLSTEKHELSFMQRYNITDDFYPRALIRPDSKQGTTQLGEFKRNKAASQYPKHASSR